MTKHIFIFAILSLLFILPENTFSQEFIIKDFKELPNDVAARANEVRDVNGDPCALIKINTGIKNLRFDGNRGVEKVDYSRKGEVWVWVPPTTRQLKISKDGIPMLPYQFPSGLTEFTVYTFTLITNQSLTITINTPGINADILINNKTFKTNLPIPELEEGEYPIQINHIGYYSIFDTLKLDFNNTFFTYKLERTNKEMLTINTEPTDCELFMNENPIGKTNHSGVYYADEYRIMIKKEKYVTIDTVIIFNPNVKKEFNFKLVKNTGFIKLSVLPENATVYIDNEIISEKKIELEAGVNHELKIQSPHYTVYTESISVNRNSIIDKNITLEKQSGKILVAIEPNGSKIELTHTDGSYYKWKGNKTMPIPEGTYNLEISKKGYNSEKTSVVVRDKETTTYQYQLSITGVNRARAGVYSALMPGWGQFHAHRKIAGAAFMASTLGLAVASIYLNSETKKLGETYDNAYNAYANSYDGSQVMALGDAMETAYNEYDEMATKRDQMVNMFLAVYITNIADAIIFAKYYSPSRRHKVKVGYLPTKKGAGVMLSYKF